MPTLDELKEIIKRLGQNTAGYHTMLENFIGGYGESNVRDALLSLGVDLASIQAELVVLKAEGENLVNNVTKAIDKDELITSYADRIDLAVPKLTLVRRSWNLGI